MAMSARMVVVLGIVMSVLCSAGDATAETLKEALAKAYQNNPALNAQRARTRQVDERVSQALSGWRPTVSAFGDIGKAETTFRQLPDQNITPREAGVRIEQPLFSGGQTVAATRRAEHQVRAERSALAATEQDVLRDAVVAYVNVLAAEAVLRFEIQNEQRLSRFLEATRDRFAVGEVTRTDVFQAEARLARAVADRVRAEGDLEATRAQYRRVIGDSPGTLVLPEVPGDLPAEASAAVALASDYNPRVLEAEYREKASRDFVDQRRGQLLPSLSVTGEAARREELVFDGRRENDLRATLRLDVPIYQAGLVYSQLRQAKQNVAETRRQVDNARRVAVRDATQAWSDLEAARARVRAFTKEVEANQVAVEGVVREQAVGTRTVLDVLDTQRDLLDSQRNLVRAHRDRIRFAYEVKRATGELTAGKLDLDVKRYEPDKYYQEVRDKWFGGSTNFDAPYTATNPR